MKIIQNKGIVSAELNWKDRNFLVHTPFRSSKTVWKHPIISDLNRELPILSFPNG